MTEHPKLGRADATYLFPLTMRVRSSAQPRFLSGYAPPLWFLMPLFRAAKEGQRPGGLCCGYFFITSQEGRPTGSYEGWEVV